MMGKMLRHRKAIAGLGLLGGFFVLKSTGCLEASRVKPEPQKPALAEQAPIVNKSQQKAREALVAVLSQNKKSAPEIRVPDDVGFGGPDPEAEEGDKNPCKEMKATALLFMSLPYEELQEAMQKTGFDELYEMKDYFNSLEGLRDAIRYGDQDSIRNAALEVLRAGSFWEKESDFHQRYLSIRRGIIKKSGKDGREKVKFIKQVSMSAHQYAQLLASM